MAKDQGPAAPATPAAQTSITPPAEPGLDDLQKILAGSATATLDDDPEATADLDTLDGATLDDDPTEADPEPEPSKARAEAAEETAADEDPAPEADPDAQAPGDTPEEPKPEADPDAALDEEIAAARDELSPRQQKAFDRALSKKAARVIRLRAELDAATQRAAQAEAALEEARATTPAPTSAPTAEDPLADVADEASLEARLAQARHTRRWARSHPDGGIVRDGDGEVEISREKVATLLADAEEILEEHAPRKRAQLQARARFDQEALQHYPDLKNPASPLARDVSQMLKRHPGLGSIFPGARLALADMLIGAHFRLTRASQAKAAPAASAQPPPKAPASPAGAARPPRVTGATKTSTEATRRLRATGDDPDNAALRTLLQTTG